MCYLQLNRRYSRGYKRSRVQGFKRNGKNYIMMLYISYGSVYKLDTQILLAGDLDLIEKVELGALKKILQKSKEC